MSSQTTAHMRVAFACCLGDKFIDGRFLWQPGHMRQCIQYPTGNINETDSIPHLYGLV